MSHDGFDHSMMSNSLDHSFGLSGASGMQSSAQLGFVPHSGSSSSHYNLQSPTSGQFADLLAEFTLPGSSSAFSPEAGQVLGASPAFSGANELDSTAAFAPLGIDHTAMQEMLMQQISANNNMNNHNTVFSQHSSPRVQQQPSSSRSRKPSHEPYAKTTSGANRGATDQVTQAIATMDSKTRTNLLNALLAMKKESKEANSANSPAANSPNSVQQTNSPRQTNSTKTSPKIRSSSKSASSRSRASVQPATHSNLPSPNNFSQPGSQMNSPQPFYTPTNTTPNSNMFSQQPQSQPQHVYSTNSALPSSMPPSSAASPAASPFLQPMNPQQQQQQQFYAAALQQAQIGAYLAAQAQAGLSQPQPGQMATPMQFPTGFQQNFQPTQAENAANAVNSAEFQAQLAELMARSGLQNLNASTSHVTQPQPASDMTMRDANFTGASYATTADGDEWAPNDFAFSPLMSPALTPASVFTQASSLPPSANSFPSQHTQLISPAEFFSPLSSPAMMPQHFLGTEEANLWAQQQQAKRQQQKNLQGLVEQTKLMKFDPNELGASTGAGSGRRGASSKKTRPSPLLKPTQDSNLTRPRKKTLTSAEKRSSSLGSGPNSAHTSPFLGPLASRPQSIKGTSVNGTAAGSDSSGSQKMTSPEEATGEINTPSPVDLTAEDVNKLNAANSLQLEREIMGPPPPPNRTSTTAAAYIQPTVPTADTSMDWLTQQPVTPASFMNFPSGIGVNNLSSLNPNQYQRILPAVPAVASNLPAQSPPAVNATVSSPPVAILPAPASTSAAGKPKPKLISKPATQPITLRTGAATALTSSKKGKTKASATAGAPLTKKVSASKAGSKTSSAQQSPTLTPQMKGGDVTEANVGADTRKSSHKAAEQKRRDSLKACFEQLRGLLPPIAISENSEDRRPGEGNVGGQRSGSVDPENPNRGVSKVALLRRSNEYLGMLHERIERRDEAIKLLRERLQTVKNSFGTLEDDEEVPGLDLDCLDANEREAGTLGFYENLDSDEEEEENFSTKPTKPGATSTQTTARKNSTASQRRKSSSVAGDRPKLNGSRRSTRNSLGNDDAMDVEPV